MKLPFFIRFHSVFLLLYGFVSGNVYADRYAVILCGSGGTDEYIERFTNWGNRLHDVLTDETGFEYENTVLFSSNIDEATETVSLPLTLDTLKMHFFLLQDQITAEDELFIFMAGHGSYLKDDVTFQLPGEDLTATAMNELLQDFQCQYLFVLNSTSSSAGFINRLSAPKRIVCTSTKSVDETNAPEYMEFFIQGLSDGSADANRDERITLLEACRQAAILTNTWYEKNNFIATEHALIDDNGDGLGTRLVPEEETDDATKKDVQSIDGGFASECLIKDYHFPDDAPRQLIDDYLSALEEINLLKQKKQDYENEKYYEMLEAKLIDAASMHYQIRQY